MKKIFVILAFIPFLLNGQSTNYSITFNLNNISGTDTVLVYDDANKPMVLKGGVVDVIIDFTDLDSDDATISLGKSGFGYDFNSLSSTLFPYTMNVTASTATVNGYVRGKAAAATSCATKPWQLSAFAGQYLFIKITKGSISSTSVLKIIIFQD